MSDAAPIDQVRECVAGALETDGVVLGPETDLVELACRLDPEALEWVLEALQRRLQLEWPLIEDAKGNLRRAQLFLPKKLTMGELCQIVDSGKWPASWSRPGKFLLFG